MFAVVAFAPSFNGPAISGRVQQQEISMSAASRREILSKVAGSAVLAAGVQGASAKAGQFGNIGIFGYGSARRPRHPRRPRRAKCPGLAHGVVPRSKKK